MTHEEMAEALALEMVEGMDTATLVTYVTETLRDHYNRLPIDTLRRKIEDYCPSILEHDTPTVEDL